jgi:hypothetical protein
MYQAKFEKYETILNLGGFWLTIVGEMTQP